jgi:hypothetical protein
VGVLLLARRGTEETGHPGRLEGIDLSPERAFDRTRLRRPLGGRVAEEDDWPHEFVRALFRPQAVLPNLVSRFGMGTSRTCRHPPPPPALPVPHTPPDPDAPSACSQQPERGGALTASKRGTRGIVAKGEAASKMRSDMLTAHMCSACWNLRTFGGASSGEQAAETRLGCYWAEEEAASANASAITSDIGTSSPARRRDTHERPGAALWAQRAMSAVRSDLLTCPYVSIRATSAVYSTFRGRVSVCDWS